jgi:predicted Ser/Thr protein kinase
MTNESDLGQEPAVTGTYVPGFLPPSLEELAKQFPQLEIVQLLGQGGMGIVYKARQPRLDRFVALKILPAETGGDAAFAERFAREARTLAKLTHPNIVTVYDFGESEGRFYLLMEFVDGVNLRHLLRERRLKPEEALKIVPQICQALQYAHDQGVVHRDIKPENILLDKRGNVKIADFGLAKLLGPKAADSALTGSQQVMGTLHYMAPEQMERPLAVDHRADIYSLGVVFYEMLTGELPLGRFAPPSQKVQVDVRLDEVVLRALEKEPEKRYQHASDVREEVEVIRDSTLSAAGSPAKQEYRKLQSVSPGDRRSGLSTFFGTTIGWAIIVCVLGVAAAFQPFLSFAELQVLDFRGVGVPIAHVFGYESPFIIAVGLIFVSVLLLFIATSVLDSFPLWRSVLVVFAGWGVLSATVWAIRLSGWNAFHDSPPAGEYCFDVLGDRLTIKYTWPREFQVSGKTTAVEMPGGKGEPPGLTSVAIKFPAHVVIGLGFALVLLGTLQIRWGLMQHHRPLTKPGADTQATPGVEAIARKHRLPASLSALPDRTTIGSLLLCLVGIGASFIPAVIVHVYNVIEPGQPSGNQRWTSFPDTGLFSWEWTTITATFLALGLYLIGTYAVQRRALYRALAIISAGTVVLVVNVLRAQVDLRVAGHMYNSPYVGFYVVAAVAVGLLILGVIALRTALANNSSDVPVAPRNALGRTLQSLWESSISLCMGSRVKGPSPASLSGATLEEQKHVVNDADSAVPSSEARDFEGSAILPRNTTSSAALSHERLPKAVAFTIKVVKAFLLIALACCLFLFLGYRESATPIGFSFQVGYPSPWFQAEKHTTGFSWGLILSSWSWAIAALGALACSLYGAIRKFEKGRQTKLEQFASRGFLLWALIVVFAFAVATIRFILMLNLGA